MKCAAVQIQDLDCFSHVWFFCSYRIEHSAAVQVTPILSLSLPFVCCVRQRWPPLLSISGFIEKLQKITRLFQWTYRELIFQSTSLLPYITLTCTGHASRGDFLLHIRFPLLPASTQLHVITLTYGLFGTNGHIILQSLTTWTITRL